MKPHGVDSGSDAAISGCDPAWRVAQRDGIAYLLVAEGYVGDRDWAFARLKGVHPYTAVAATLSPWVPVDRRALERYPAEMSATVVSRGCEHPIRVLDLSFGGLALTVPRTVPLGISAVRLGETVALTLPIRVLRVEERDVSLVVHAQFGTLTEVARQHLADLIRTLTGPPHGASG